MASDENPADRERLRLELLWAQDAPRRPGKPELSLRRIVGAAITIADQEGLEGLSMRRVATQLKAGTMSLYRYVPGKEELIDLMVDSVAGEIPLPDPAPNGWRDRLTWSAQTDWTLYQRHPWALQVLATTRPPLGPNVLRLTEFAVASVDGLDLPTEHMSWLVMMVTGYVQGAALLMVNESNAQRETGATRDQWWENRSATILELMRQHQFPTLARIAEASAPGQNLDDWFHFGLERVLDGIETFLNQRR